MTDSHRERMLRGDLYQADGPELASERATAAELCRRFNALPPATSGGALRAILGQLLRAFGQRSEIRPPFPCDYGRAGAVATRDLPVNVVAVGNPAGVVCELEPGGADLVGRGREERVVAAAARAVAELVDDPLRQLVELVLRNPHALHRLLHEALDLFNILADECLGQFELGLHGYEPFAPLRFVLRREDGRKEAREEGARAGDADAVFVGRGKLPRDRHFEPRAFV